jgi:hypothetical protein
MDNEHTASSDQSGAGYDLLRAVENDGQLCGSEQNWKLCIVEMKDTECAIAMRTEGGSSRNGKPKGNDCNRHEDNINNQFCLRCEVA